MEEGGDMYSGALVTPTWEPMEPRSRFTRRYGQSEIDSTNFFNLKVSVKVLGTFSQIEYSKEWGRRVGQVERIEENHVKDTSVIYLKSQEELRKLP